MRAMALSPKPFIVGADEKPNPGSDGTTTWKAGLSGAAGKASQRTRHTMKRSARPGFPWPVCSSSLLSPGCEESR